MFRHVPSPAALRTFESAARLKSFKEAAEELGVTPTAVSHQIRILEELLGIALFIRQTRSVNLTEEGAILASVVHSSFLEIKNAIDDIKLSENILTVTTTPAFAALRIVPKLGEFYSRHPEIKVRLETGTTPSDLQNDRRLDIAIRYGKGPYPNMHSVPLIQETFGAYCSRDYLNKCRSPQSGILLETAWQQKVLQNINWKEWFIAAGEKISTASLTINYFDEEYFVLQAAIAGQGVVLASSALVQDFINKELLISYRPEISLPGAGYTAICLQRRARSAKIKCFIDWLRDIFVYT